MKNQALRAIEIDWQIRRFSKKFWILSTVNFVFILHDNIKNFPLYLPRNNKFPLYLPQNMILLYYNRRTKKFRLYEKNKITIKTLNALCNAFKCPIPSYMTHEIYINSFNDPDHTKFEKSPKGDIYFQELKCGENCVIYNGEYYLIEITNFNGHNYGVLDLSRQGIRDISEIEGLDALLILGELDLNDNQITEIKGIENLKNLYNLNLSCNKLTEIRGLDTLLNLSELNLSENEITEIKGIENLKKLYSLNFSSNKLTEIKGLEYLKRLRYLNLKDNLIKEIKGLENFLVDRDGDIKINLRDNRIPLRLLIQLGRLNKEGYAKTPEKIVDYCIKNKREIEKFDRRSIVKLKKIVRISNRFRLDMMMDLLDIDKISLIKNIEKWSAEFDLEINGNYLIIKKDTVQEFMDALDKQFNEWERI